MSDPRNPGDRTAGPSSGPKPEQSPHADDPLVRAAAAASAARSRAAPTQPDPDDSEPVIHLPQGDPPTGSRVWEITKDILTVVFAIGVGVPLFLWLVASGCCALVS